MAQPGFNYNFTDADTLQLCQHAAALIRPPRYACRWVTPHGICGSVVQGPEFSEHLRSHHGIRGPEKEKVTCCWDGCFAVMNKESLQRHINEKHLELRYPCPNCPEQFSRPYTMQNHVTKKHTGN